MAQIEFALVKEQNQQFAVVVVQDYLITSSMKRDEHISYFEDKFGCPVVLLGARQHKYYGSPNIVRFLSRISLARLPWRKGTIH